MHANRQTLGDEFAASAALLGGIRGWDGFCSLASIRCFAREDGQKLTPASVSDRLVEARFAAGLVGQIRTIPIRLGLWAGAEVLALDSFVVDGVILAHQAESRLMVKVQPLSPDLLVSFGKQLYGFAPPMAALLTTADTGAAPVSAPFRLCGSAGDSR